MEVLALVDLQETGSLNKAAAIYRNLSDDALEESTLIQDLSLHAFEALERRMDGSDEYNSEDRRRLELLKYMAEFALKTMAIETARRFEDKFISDLLRYYYIQYLYKSADSSTLSLVQ